MEKISYSLGLSVAGNLLKSGVDKLDQEAFAKGILHGLGGGDVEITAQEVNQILNDYFMNLQNQVGDKNKAEGENFLRENSIKEGVVILSSGLQYQVLVSGDGPKPKATDSVKCHYHGTLINGNVFDSSVQRGTPAVFPVNGVIAGWVEALQLMNVGSKWRLFIPSNLAYGERGAGDQIGANTTLIFEVELLGIE
ncbi:MAG: FKBP-type peptidyl-prolyl cis-trans isomerase [Marinilabiliaceae bacterium]|nr:FKBP-type peptidyl-prolyl cis-trans isomerase [Marinilabiliaceae bacterium]